MTRATATGGGVLTVRLDEDIERLLARVVKAAIAPVAADPPRVEVRDPDDAVILDEALAVGAALLITGGDRDLLDLRAGGMVVRLPRSSPSPCTSGRTAGVP
jgi:predicted nucleic acid-binding protein